MIDSRLTISPVAEEHGRRGRQDVLDGTEVVIEQVAA